MCSSVSVEGHTFVDRPGSEYRSMGGETRIWQDCSGCGNVTSRLADVYPAVDYGTFETAMVAARGESDLVREMTSAPTDVEMSVYVLAPDHRSGYCVRPDGELVLVWSLERGRGDIMVAQAVADGATHLDCFDGYLVDLYGRHGFQRVCSLPNWTEGEPAVVYMAQHGHFLAALDRAEADAK